MAQVIDWNLLVALDALLAEGSVTAAAERLHLSVPATSRTLGRIRKTFDDPILVRSGRGLIPTPRALALQERLHALVEEAHALVDIGREVDLASLRRTFTIRANDALLDVLAVPLLSRMRASAPGVTLRFMAEGAEDLAPLRDGLVDLDIGAIANFGPEVRSQLLYEERQVGMVSAGHPLATGRMSLRRIAALEHVVVSRRGRVNGALDEALALRGLSRTVVAVVPTFTAAVDLIMNSELTGLINSKYASRVADLNGARIYQIPIQLPTVPISQAWHVRYDLDPVHDWLRQEVLALFGNDAQQDSRSEI